jgi:hypothetical protein
MASRFLLSSSSIDGEVQQHLENAKHVGEVIDWHAVGTYFVHAKLVTAKFNVYEVCCNFAIVFTSYPRTELTNQLFFFSSVARAARREGRSAVKR